MKSLIMCIKLAKDDCIFVNSNKPFKLPINYVNDILPNL